MNADTIYAVVDLETTGTSVKQGDRIIQFGAALIQHGKIIQTVSQLINPDRGVPDVIQRLTGIAPETLVSAPFFEEVAAPLSQLLTDTVFVAHNVNFDLPFLSAEFERVGLPKMTNAAIDTVELAQVLLPTLSSYRLTDLTHYLKIHHDNPHHADSDAVSTAKLLLALRDRFLALPSQTQIELVKRGSGLLRETGEFLGALAPEQMLPLDKSHQQIGPLVFKRPATMTTSTQPVAYPEDDQAKRKLLRPQYRFRKAQAKMMDAIHVHAQSGEGPLFIEAGTGLGKSFGYLVPMLSVTSSQQKLVVATSTLVLQQQLLTQTLPALAQLLGQPIPMVSLKSARHYLDLNKLAVSLNQPDPPRQTLVLQMKLLVWLTETDTGDLDELHMTTYRAPLFLQVRHTGEVTSANNPYLAVDFFKRRDQALKAAQVVVTNHAFLARHQAELAPLNAYLVVDEAQHFADNTAAAFGQKVEMNRLQQIVHHLRELTMAGEGRSLMQVYDNDQVHQYLLMQLQAENDSAEGMIQKLLGEVYQHFFRHQHVAGTGFVTLTLSVQDVTWLLDHEGRALLELAKHTRHCAQLITQLTQDFERRAPVFLAGDMQLFQTIEALGVSLEEYATRIEALHGQLQALLTTQTAIVSLSLRNISDQASLSLQWEVFEVGEAVQTLLQAYRLPTFVGATLTSDRRFDFLAHQLGYQELPEGATDTFRSPFHYRDQAQFIVANDVPAIQSMSESAYAHFLTDAISALADNDHQTIVLFNSLKVIAAVYHELAKRPIADHKEVLAQGVTGSAEKIAKRFAVATNSLLLGAASFFEGIDYPEKTLEIVILTRLPFDSPERPVTKAREHLLKAQGQEPFTTDALPRATLRFRQSFGRLIRTEHDRGVFIVLDDRLLTTKYGRQMQKTLPNLKPLALPLVEIPAYISMWLDQIPKKD